MHLGFTRIPLNANFYLKKVQYGIVMLVLYVNDLIIINSSNYLLKGKNDDLKIHLI